MESSSFLIRCIASKILTTTPANITKPRNKRFFIYHYYKTIISMKVGLAIISCLLVLSSSKLVYLAELFCHMARYSTADIYDAKETKQMGGSLTAVGMHQQHILGSYLCKYSNP